jgi:hypothetical protein
MTWLLDPTCKHGSVVMTGKRFTVHQLRGPVFGPSHYRQKRANELGAVCHAEGHLNASTNRDANYAECILAQNAGDRTKLWARDFLTRLSVQADIRSTGYRQEGPGAGNISRVHAPAMLLEPGFVSNPHWAAFCRTGEGSDCIGRCLAESIAETFPGGLVCLSVGHAYRRDGSDWSGEEKRGDGGAPVADPDEGVPENPAFDEEAELVELYITSAAEHLVAYE